MKRTLPVSLLLALSLTACGGGDAPQDPVDAGYEAHANQDYAAAVAAFDEAVAAHPDDAELKVARLQSLARIDGEQAAQELIALEGTSEKDFSSVIGELFSADDYANALVAADAGKKRFPDSEAFPGYIAKIQKKAKDSGDAGLTSALDGLGYGGGTDD